MPTRRQTLTGFAAAAAPLSFSQTMSQAAAAGHTFDLSDPNDVIAAYARMRGNLDGTPGMWWYRGNVFAKRDGDVAVRVLKIEGSVSTVWSSATTASSIRSWPRPDILSILRRMKLPMSGSIP